MTQSNNVIEFPFHENGFTPAQNSEQLLEQFQENKKTYINQVVDHYSTQLINKLGMHGFDIYEDNFIKSFSYTVESLRATLYQSLDIYHPFEDHMGEIMEALEEFEENS